MKLIVVVLLTIFSAVVSANEYDNIDWTKVIPIQELPGFWDNREIKPVVVNSRDRSSRITGGEIVPPNSLPMQVALMVTAAPGIGLCGGTIISVVSLKYSVSLYMFFFNSFFAYAEFSFNCSTLC